MKNILKLSLVIALTFFVGISQAHAANLVWSTDTIVSLTSPTVVDLTIVGGSSNATAFVVEAGDIIVTVAAGEVFTVQATTYNISSSVSAGVVNTCTAGVAQLVITGSGGGVAHTVSATGPKCGTGGGGGGGGTPADTTVPTGTISIDAGATTTSLLAATLTLSATDNVGVTQMLISNDAGFAGATWEAYATSKAWTLTSGDGLKTVYAKFKDVAGNVSATALDTITVSGTGTVALPPTEPAGGCSGGNLFNTSTGAACVNNVGNENQTSSVHHYNFGTTTLKNGSKGEGVKELQRFLNAKLNLGLAIDGKLGPKTIAVIKKWQKDNNLKSDGLIGAKTKAKMNSME